MTEPLHHLGDAFHVRPLGQSRSRNHDHGQAERAGRVDLGARAIAAGIAGDDPRDAARSHHFELAVKRERSARHDHIRREGQGSFGRIDKTQRVSMLRPRREWRDVLAADGKELRHAQGAQVVTLTHPVSQYYRGSQLVEAKSNEIPAVRDLLERVDVTGCMVGIDALHTQDETARQIVQEAGGDYLLTVKANQKKLRQTLAQKLPEPEQLFSPSTAAAAALGADRTGK